jgi:hypothetical protein
VGGDELVDVRVGNPPTGVEFDLANFYHFVDHRARDSYFFCGFRDGVLPWVLPGHSLDGDLGPAQGCVADDFLKVFLFDEYDVHVWSVILNSSVVRDEVAFDVEFACVTLGGTNQHLNRFPPVCPFKTPFVLEDECLSGTLSTFTLDFFRLLCVDVDDGVGFHDAYSWSEERGLLCFGA